MLSGFPAEVVPLAVAVAVSPLPLVIMLVILLTPRAVVNGLAFMAGWATALLMLGGGTVVLFGASAQVDEGGTTVSRLEVVVGVGLLALGGLQWRRWSRAGAATAPTWLQAVDQWTAVRAFSMAILALGVSPKNLALTVTAAGLVAGSSEASGSAFLPLAVFVALGAAGLAVPLTLRLCLGAGVAGMLRRCRGWLLVHGPRVACGLLLLLGALLVSRGVT